MNYRVTKYFEAILLFQNRLREEKTQAKLLPIIYIKVKRRNYSCA
jgi:hypothetical protein